VKISVITASYNCVATIRNCVESVICQKHKDVEHIIIDGASSDGTLEKIDSYKDKIAKIVSEPDNGIYHALNKGLKIASGSIIGILHADDIYANDRVLDTVATVFRLDNIDSCYGDLQYVDKDNAYRIIRHWKSSNYKLGKFRHGWMPPHSTFFVKRGIYERYGYFDTSFRIAADYELMLRFLKKHKISTQYIPEVLIKMRLGGASNKSIKNIIIKSFEDYKALKKNNVNTALPTLLLKNISKIPQFIIKT